MRLWLALGILLLAGCSSAPSLADAPTDTTAPSSEPAPTNAPPMPRLKDAAPHTLYFRADAGISNVTPDAGTIAVGSDVTALFLGNFGVTFESEPLARALYIEPGNVRANLWLEGAGPLVSNGQFDVGVWLGSPLAMPGFGITAHEPAVAPATPVLVSLDVPFAGSRGLVIPVGEVVRIIIAADFTAQPSLVQMHTGGAMASNVTFTAREFNVDPLDGFTFTQTQKFTGDLVAPNNPFFCNPAPGTTDRTHEFTVGASTASLHVAVQPKSGTTPHQDIDLTVLRGTDILAQAATPSGNEGTYFADLAAEGLAGEQLTLVLSACTGGQVTYEVVVTEGIAPVVAIAAVAPAPAA